jgi:membrane protease YdiL (CAAX protease family)
MFDSGERSIARRVFVNGRERRLRAGWRVITAVVVLALTRVVLTWLTEGLPALLPPNALVPSVLFDQTLGNVQITLVLVAVAWYVDRRALPDLGLGGRDWWPNLAFGLALGFVMTTVVFAAELAAGLVAVDGFLVSRPGLGVDASFPVALAATALMFVAVGVGEEVLVRGYLMTNVAEGLNGLGPVGPRAALGTAAVLTSVLFGALHYANPAASLLSAFNISVLGLFFAGTYVVTEDLGVPIGIHVTWNFSLSSVYGFPVSGITTPATFLDVRQAGDPLLTGGAFGPEAGLAVYLALAVAIALTWWWVRRTRGPMGFPTGVAVPDLRRSPGPRADAE